VAQNPEPEEEDESLVIEFSAPPNFGICYLRAALKTGMQSLVSSRVFVESAGNVDATGYMKEAEHCLEVLLGLVGEAETSVFQAINQSRSSQAVDTTVSEFPGGFAKTGSGDESGGPLDEG